MRQLLLSVGVATVVALASVVVGGAGLPAYAQNVPCDGQGNFCKDVVTKSCTREVLNFTPPWGWSWTCMEWREVTTRYYYRAEQSGEEEGSNVGFE
jgi:hypothetical protein